MNRNLILRRIISAIIDSCIIFVLLFFVGFCYLRLFPLSETDYQGAPFFLILSLLMPGYMVLELLKEPGGFSIVDPFCSLIVILFVFEWLFWCLIEVVLSGRTIGKSFFGLKIVFIAEPKFPFFNMALRNLLKVISKYLLGIPFVFLLFSKNHETIYDKLSKITVCLET